jgi:hypothetical protein
MDIIHGYELDIIWDIFLGYSFGYLWISKDICWITNVDMPWISEVIFNLEKNGYPRISIG